MATAAHSSQPPGPWEVDAKIEASLTPFKGPQQISANWDPYTQVATAGAIFSTSPERSVYAAIEPAGGRVVVKSFDGASLFADNGCLLSMVNQEIEAHYSLACPGIAPLLATFPAGGRLHLVFEAADADLATALSHIYTAQQHDSRRAAAAGQQAGKTAAVEWHRRVLAPGRKAMEAVLLQPLMRNVGPALAAMHAMGLSHRGVCPSNIVLTFSPAASLASSHAPLGTQPRAHCLPLGGAAGACAPAYRCLPHLIDLSSVGRLRPAAWLDSSKADELRYLAPETAATCAAAVQKGACMPDVLVAMARAAAGGAADARALAQVLAEAALGQRFYAAIASGNGAASSAAAGGGAAVEPTAGQQSKQQVPLLASSAAGHAAAESSLADPEALECFGPVLAHAARVAADPHPWRTARGWRKLGAPLRALIDALGAADPYHRASVTDALAMDFCTADLGTGDGPWQFAGLAQPHGQGRPAAGEEEWPAPTACWAGRVASGCNGMTDEVAAIGVNVLYRPDRPPIFRPALGPMNDLTQRRTPLQLAARWLRDLATVQCREVCSAAWQRVVMAAAAFRLHCRAALDDLKTDFEMGEPIAVAPSGPGAAGRDAREGWLDKVLAVAKGSAQKQPNKPPAAGPAPGEVPGAAAAAGAQENVKGASMLSLGSVQVNACAYELWDEELSEEASERAWSAGENLWAPFEYRAPSYLPAGCSGFEEGEVEGGEGAEECEGEMRV